MPVIKLGFLDVGQGDTTVISCPETQEAIVVDCIDSEATIDYLEREGIRHLRAVIITHMHQDHYKQVGDLLINSEDKFGTRGCEVLGMAEYFIDPQKLTLDKSKKRWPPDSDEHSLDGASPDLRYIRRVKSQISRIFQWCKENAARCSLLQVGPNIRFPYPIQGTIADCLVLLHPPFIYYNDLRSPHINNVSVILCVKGEGSTALLTGDLEPAGWQILKQQHSNLQCDVLKFPHHGGNWTEADTDDLLSIVQPSTVVVSVGSNNTYDHPNTSVFESFKKQDNLRVLCTQATNKCQWDVLDQRSAVMAKFEAQMARDSSFYRPPSRNQCPCSGTVVIELRDQPYILQPEQGFHENLIRDHYKVYKCKVKSLSVLS